MKWSIALLLVGVASLNWVALSSAQESDSEEGRQTATINFPGGTLSDYIDMIRKRIPVSNLGGELQPMNIFLTEDARSVRMPSVEMTTTIHGALGILETISNDRQNILVNQFDDVTTIGVENRNSTRVKVINAKQLLEKMVKEDLLSAIEIGIQMQGNEGSIGLKLHEQTGLLFVKGMPDSTELVDQIVAELYKANEIGLGIGAPMGGAVGGGGHSDGSIGGVDFRGGIPFVPSKN